MAHYDSKEEEEDDDVFYDEEFGACYRIYCTFECKHHRIPFAWISDDGWLCYDDDNHSVE